MEEKGLLLVAWWRARASQGPALDSSPTRTPVLWEPRPQSSLAAELRELRVPLGS